MMEPEAATRKVIAVVWLSLDGVMEAPDEWASPYSDDDMEQADAVAMAESDALLLGRVTYEEFAAFWPNQPAGTLPVDHINTVRKYVVSGTLKEPLGWNNSTLIKGDEFAEQVAELKRQPGKNIEIVGSGTLVRSLLEEGLVDELRLMIHPLVLGSGMRLFDEGVDRQQLKLAKTETFGSGVAVLTYRVRK